MNKPAILQEESSMMQFVTALFFKLMIKGAVANIRANRLYTNEFIYNVNSYMLPWIYSLAVYIE
jgi:hypothetical protein